MNEAAKSIDISRADDTRHFYSALPALDHFGDVTDTRYHVDLPPDWDIVIADVVGSTKAIQAGRYKDVNMIGAACIAAITNIDRSIQIPFIFGGDGATFAVPSFMRDRVRNALAGTRAMARESFSLELRAGIVPQQDVTALGAEVRMGKYRMSEFVSQPALSGRGWVEAERLIKDSTYAHEYLIEESRPIEHADFTGLACRWNSIPSKRDCKIALLAISMASDQEQHAKHYCEVMNAINRIVGSIEDAHPVDESLMGLSLRWGVLAKEAAVRARGRGLFSHLTYVARIFVLDLIGLFLLARKVDTETTQWSRYKSDFVRNSDYKKFDGMLRMVLDVTEEQKEQLVAALEKMRQNGAIKYGVHASPQAIVTCLVSDYNGHHTHFVDGSDGGYAMAAVQLKAQLAE